MLTTREIATIIWFVPAAALMWWKWPTIRDPIRSVVRILIQPVLLAPAALFTVWMLVAVYLAARLGAWTLANLKDTLYWFVPGYLLLFGAVKAASEKGFFRRRIRDAVGLSAFFAFYLSVSTLDLIWELILVPLLTLLTLVAAVGGVSFRGSTGVSARAGDRARLIGGVVVAGLLIYATVRLVQNAGTTDWAELGRTLALPAWLTLWAVPFVLAVSVYAEYDTALSRMRFSTTDKRIPRRAVLALMVSFRFRRTALDKFAGRWPGEVANAKGFRDARDVIKRQEAEVAAGEVAKQKAADDLRNYAGAVGLDDHGRQLDRREFRETVEALETLASSHMAWYRNSGNRYQRDLLEKFGGVFTRDLPADHGITMKVSHSGQSWYAWRRTPSGLCFAIGAAGPPPDQRCYEGMAPPSGFPKVRPGWSEPYEHGPNWAWVDDREDSWAVDEAIGGGDAEADAGA